MSDERKATEVSYRGVNGENRASSAFGKVAKLSNAKLRMCKMDQSSLFIKPVPSRPFYLPLRCSCNSREAARRMAQMVDIYHDGGSDSYCLLALLASPEWRHDVSKAALEQIGHFASASRPRTGYSFAA